MVVVKIDGDPILCKTDEVGELCVSASYTGVSYWGLKGFSTHVFRVCCMEYMYYTVLFCNTVCCNHVFRVCYVEYYNVLFCSIVYCTHVFRVCCA